MAILVQMINEKVSKFLASPKYKTYKVMYHITTNSNAKNIIKNGFDTSKAQCNAFGKGINLTDKLEDLKNYHDKTHTVVILCLVRYNKLLLNISTKKRVTCNTGSYSKPKYMNVPTGYDGFSTTGSIFVIKNKRNVHPLCTFEYSDVHSQYT